MHHALAGQSPADTQLVDRLLTPEAFDHPVMTIERIETHISWVILTDTYAYKIKKPLVLDFLDFGSVEKRHYFCEEELRLNRPWAADIYLAVVPITESGGQVRFGGDGKVRDYAVKMRRFESDMRLDRQLQLGRLTLDDMEALGETVAGRHLEAPRVKNQIREHTIRMTVQQMHDNFVALEGSVGEEDLSSLRKWTERELDRLTDAIAARFDAGFFRDCHGDLHLANLVRMPDGIRTFDCIEFNDDLRRTDVVCDVAFLVMDLVSKGRRELAAQFLNRYLERTGDYDGVAFLDVYFVYRCLVRAKVAVIASRDRDLEGERQRDLADADRYCRFALRQTWKPAPALIIMRGLSGSGKTWVSGQLMVALPAIRLRSDIERKRLFGLAETAATHSSVGTGIYRADASRRVYQTLVSKAKSILDARHNVILDATFLRIEERDLALGMADSCGYTAMIVDVRAPQALLESRLEQRLRLSPDASEATLDVLEHQWSIEEPLAVTEFERTIVYDNVDEASVKRLVDLVRAAAGDLNSRFTAPT